MAGLANTIAQQIKMADRLTRMQLEQIDDRIAAQTQAVAIGELQASVMQGAKREAEAASQVALMLDRITNLELAQ